MTGWNIKKAITPIFMLLPCAVFAKSGSVNYSWGADALASMHDFVVTMMMYVPKVLNKAECRRRKLNELYDKINCFSMIYGQNGNYNLS